MMTSSRVYKTGIVCLSVVIIMFSAICSAPADAAVVDFEALREEAPDSVAWIQLPDTRLNYPVVYGTDNDFYLTHLPDGSESKSGSIFIDYRNSPDFTDPNTLIHGHRMDTGTMFGTLNSYVLQEYYDTHQIVKIFTPQGDRDVHLFAGYPFNQMEETMPVSFENEDSFHDYIRFVKERSMFESDVEVNPGELLVTLVTCDYDTDAEDGRLMLVGKLLN